MLEEAGKEVLGSVLLKASCLPLSFLLVVPAVLLLLGPLVASGAHDFTVYRMQQYELGGQAYGTRNVVLSTEARTVEADVLSRRCVMMRLADFSYEQYQKALRQSAGAVVIVLPQSMSSVPQDVIRQFMEIEPEMLATETIVPVYFAKEDDDLLSIYEQTQAASASQGSASAAEVAFSRRRVKPAIFDLLLALCIAAYLGAAYVAVQHFGLLYKLVQRLSLKSKQQ